MKYTKRDLIRLEKKREKILDKLDELENELTDVKILERRIRKMLK